MKALELLAQFRQQLYQTVTRRATALLEVIDAVAQVARPHSPAELSLVMQRHWSSLYDALDEGRFEPDALRPLLAATAGQISAYRVADCRVVVVDQSGYPRPQARTVAERERYPGPNDTRQTGHRYSFLSQLVEQDSSWLAPLDVERIGPESTPVGIALTQVARLAQTSTDPVIAVGDREYGVNDILRVVPQVPGVPLHFVARLRTNLVFYEAPPSRQPGQKGGIAQVWCSCATQRPSHVAGAAVEGQRGDQRWRSGRPAGLERLAAARHSQCGGAGRPSAGPQGGWAAGLCPAVVVDGMWRRLAVGRGLAARSAALARRDPASPSQGSNVKISSPSP